MYGPPNRLSWTAQTRGNTPPWQTKFPDDGGRRCSIQASSRRRKGDLPMSNSSKVSYSRREFSCYHLDFYCNCNLISHHPMELIVLSYCLKPCSKFYFISRFELSMGIHRGRETQRQHALSLSICKLQVEMESVIGIQTKQWLPVDFFGLRVEK
jgi:hypothetical protein